jgi:hypothetical protein
MPLIILAYFLIFVGAGLLGIGLYLPELIWGIVGGIMLLAGIFWMVTIRRGRGPLVRNLWD